MKHPQTERQRTVSGAEHRHAAPVSVGHEAHASVVTRMDHSLLSLFAKYYQLVLLFAALSALYLVGVMFEPLQPSVFGQYHMGAGKELLRTLAVYVPFVCIWFIGLMGYLRLRNYTEQILPSRDGHAFRHVSRGVFVLTLWLPVSAVLNVLTAYYRDHDAIIPTIARISNYTNVAALLVAFVLIYYGSRQLLRMIHQPEPSSLLGTLVYIAFAMAYTYLTFHNSGIDAIRQRAVMANFYLPDQTVLWTVAVPRLVSWYLGVRAAYNLYAYRANVAGKLYKQALTSLSAGLAGVVILSATYRSAQVIIPKLHVFNLIGVVSVLYAVLAALGVGYLLMAHGARKLQRIEKL